MPDCSVTAHEHENLTIEAIANPMLEYVIQVLSDILLTGFLLSLLVLFLIIVILYFRDISQTKSAIRKNYPVIGRFRYLFEHLGEFFRQYFFAMDREELPFNRALRSWVYRASKNTDMSIAFGSTRNLYKTGEVYFLNDTFPKLDTETLSPRKQIIGPNCAHPYETPSFFNISAMSYGALSANAITALSKGAAQAGCWLNTGEGGLSSFHELSGCDLVYQIGTAKYGVRDDNGNLCKEKLGQLAAKPAIKMFEIKLSQGAKPGKGGILPAEKVTKEIARIRGIPVGQASHSPNRHLDIQSNDDLLDMIQVIRETTGKPVGFKAVLGDPSWFTAFCGAVHSRGVESAPDFITIDSADGGTGAAPQPLMDFVGLPLKESLPFIVDELIRLGLKERIKVIASGKLIAPSYVATALATGADFVTSARGFMFALGCIQALQCNKNTCPTGITTHNKHLQKGLHSMEKSNRVANYHKNITKSVSIIAHSCGVQNPHELARKHIRVVAHTGYSLPLEEVIKHSSH